MTRAGTSRTPCSSPWMMSPGRIDKPATSTVVETFTRTKTKAALFGAALARGLLIAPITTIAEVVDSPQLAARNYWQPLEHPELDQAFRYPGAFAQFSATPIAYRRRPPTIGEHNREIYLGELGFTAQELGVLQSRGVV